MPDPIQDRVDIATIILAVAMVLVALVATGVLLQTSGLIGRPLEDIATKIKIQSVVLHCDPTDPEHQVKTVTVIIENLPKSTDVDFGDLTVSWRAGDTGVKGIRYNAGGAGAGLVGFGIEDMDGNGNFMFEVGETVAVQLDLGEEFSMGEGTEFTVVVTPEGGPSETATRTTPQEITKDRYEL